MASVLGPGGTPPRSETLVDGQTGGVRAVFPANIRDEKKLIPFVSFSATRYVDIFHLSKDTDKSAFTISPLQRSEVDGTPISSEIQQPQTLCDIYLPLPADVQNSIAPGWEIQNSIVTTAIADLTSKLRGGSVTGTDFKKALVGLGASGLSVSGTGALGRIGGLTVNPKKQALFGGIETREFSFNYILTPQSEQEADQIHNIVKLFNKFSLPFLSDFADTDAFLNFPSEWNINFHGVKGFPEIKKCVCTNVVTTWAPGSMQLLKSGHAVQVGITLAFKEIDIRTQENYGIGN